MATWTTLYAARFLMENEVSEQKDEEAMFEVWWALRRQKSWDKSCKDRGPHPNENWGIAAYRDCKEAWMARAGLHVVYARGAAPIEQSPDNGSP